MAFFRELCSLYSHHRLFDTFDYSIVVIDYFQDSIYKNEESLKRKERRGDVTKEEEN